MVTSNDVARHVGLSQSTVSRALRGHPAVTEATRRRVREAATALGYLPSAAARSLVTNRTGAVGIVVADLASPFYAPAVAAIQERLTERGYRMALIRDPGTADGSSGLEVLSESTVDGMVVMSASEGSATIDRIVARNMPLVLLSRGLDTDGLDAVLADDLAAGELVVAHLAERGHRRIGVISALATVLNARDRVRGLRGALARRGLELPDELVRHDVLGHQQGAAMATSLLTSADPPTALFCTSDTFAFGALDAAAKLGIRVPRDVSVVGFDDSEPAGWAMVDLTTVRQPTTDMARRAADVLLSRLTGSDSAEHPVVHDVFPVDLVVRGTTGMARTT